MGKNLYISNFKKLPVVFFSSIVLFLGAQFMTANSSAFWKACYPFAAHDNLRLEATLKTMPDDESQIKVVILGSSQAREGVDAEYLNSKFSKDNVAFYNLGCSGGASPIDMFMIKDEIISVNPDVIVYIPYIGNFYGNYDYTSMKYYFNPEIIPYMLKYVGFSEILNYKGCFLDSFMGTFSDFYKYREGFRDVFFDAVAAKIKRDKPAGKYYHYNESKPKSYFEQAIRESEGNQFKVTKYTELNKDLFALFTKDVVCEKIKLIVMSGPTNPLIKRCYRREIDTMYNEFLSDQSVDTGFTYLSENELPEFEEEDFIDFLHLNQKGRKKLSQVIESKMKKIVM